MSDDKTDLLKQAFMKAIIATDANNNRRAAETGASSSGWRPLSQDR